MSTIVWAIIIWWIVSIIIIYIASFKYGRTIRAADDENIRILKKKEQRKELEELLEEEGIKKYDKSQKNS
jgi:flagellar biosynthesis/type III secretory pathway M-ring protein FliF/YscJ